MNRHPELARALEALCAQGPLSVLVVYEHVPRPDAAGADLRVAQVLEALADAGQRVTLIGRGANTPRSYHAALEARGITVLAPDPERVHWEELDAPRIDLEALCARERFDVAILVQYFWVGVSVAEQYLDLLRRHSPHTRIVLVDDDCHWLREERRARISGNRSDLERSRGLRAKELDACSRADLVLTITGEDAARLAEELPGLALQKLSFCQDEIPAHVPGFDARRDLLFVGSGANDANVQAVRWFAAEILPHVRAALPDVRLRIVGESPAAGWGCENDPGVCIEGRIADLAQPLGSARVFVSPITYGTGLKTKNVQALGSGLPMVATPISAEGMDLQGDAAALVRTDPRAFAEAVVRLCSDRALWERTSQAGLAHAREHFSRQRVVRDLCTAFARVRSAPARARDERPAPGMLVEPLLADRLPGAAFPRRNAAHVELAREFKRTGRFAEAQQELRNVFCELCCLPPDARLFAELHGLMASIYLANGETGEAALAAQEALRLDPGFSAEAREVLGRIGALAGASPSSVSVPGPAASPENESQTAPDAIAQLLAGAARACARGELAIALDACVAALALDQRHAPAWNDLGVLLHACGEHDEASAAFDSALCYAPKVRAARVNRARLALERGDYADAARDVEVLLAQDPDDPEVGELAQALAANAAA